MPLYKVKGYICVPLVTIVRAADADAALVEATGIYEKSIEHDPNAKDYKIHIAEAKPVHE